MNHWKHFGSLKTLIIVNLFLISCRFMCSVIGLIRNFKKIMNSVWSTQYLQYSSPSRGLLWELPMFSLPTNESYFVENFNKIASLMLIMSEYKGSNWSEWLVILVTFTKIVCFRVLYQLFKFVTSFLKPPVYLIFNGNQEDLLKY